MSINPFDDEAGSFYVLVNFRGEHSLWPVFADVPSGWDVAHGPSDRVSAVQYVEQNWSAMRPQ